MKYAGYCIAGGMPFGENDGALKKKRDEVCVFIFLRWHYPDQVFWV